MKLFAEPILWIDREEPPKDVPVGAKQEAEEQRKEDARSFLEFIERAITPPPPGTVEAPAPEASYIDRYSWLFSPKAKG